MPRALLINWNDALTYYQSTGSLKAVAERFNIKETAVRQYSRRHGWPTLGAARTIERKAAAVREAAAVVQNATELVGSDPAQLVGEALKEAGGKFRLSLSRSLTKAAAEIEEAPEALEHSRRMVDLVTAGKAVFGFDQSAPVIEVRALSLGLDAFVPSSNPVPVG